jgi:hypothetical protein
MCPACIATAALIAAGATSAGGVTALALKILRPKGGADQRPPDHPPESKENGS